MGTYCALASILHPVMAVSPPEGGTPESQQLCSRSPSCQPGPETGMRAPGLQPPRGRQVGAGWEGGKA